MTYLQLVDVDKAFSVGGTGRSNAYVKRTSAVERPGMCEVLTQASIGNG